MTRHFEIDSSVAQLVEQTTVNRWVAGSSPARGAIFIEFHGAVAQLVRASACHAEGRGFESHQLRQSSLIRGFSLGKLRLALPAS